MVKAKTVEANIYNFKEWITIIDPIKIKQKYETSLKKSGFLILKYDEYFFPETGFTCFWLLGESHLAIHTFPEENKTYVELSSCNLEKLELFKKL